MAQGECVHNGIAVLFEWRRELKEDGTTEADYYTFRPPEGMDFDDVVEYLNSHIGKQWAEDEDVSPGDDRLVYAVQGFYYDRLVYIPFERLTRADLVRVLEKDGFARQND